MGSDDLSCKTNFLHIHILEMCEKHHGEEGGCKEGLELEERIIRHQEAVRLRKQREAQERISKQKEIEEKLKHQQLKESMKRQQETEKLIKPKEAEENEAKQEEEVRIKRYQEFMKLVKQERVKEAVRQEEEEEKTRKQQEEARLQERIKRIHILERHRKQKEAEENVRKQEEERLKQDQQRREKIKKMQELERLRKKEAEEKIRKRQEEGKLKQEQQLQEGIKRIQELERNRKQNEVQEKIRRQQEEERLRIQYFAGLQVENTYPRKVKVWVQFDDTTHRRLVEELAKYSGDKTNLCFSLTVTNLQTHVKRSDQFQKNVSFRTGLPLEYSLKLGNRYKFEVNVKKYSPIHRDFTIFLTKAIEHKEMLLKSELQMLMQKAKQFQQCRLNRQRLPVRFGYRNKSHLYFDQIKHCRSNIMEVYIKDNNGDPGCPINGQINGLFFAVRPEPSTMTIPTESLFGNVRIILPIEKLVESCPNFYFADFYCHKKIHYLTLVATKPNSQADQFCRDHLLEISLDNNPFFFHEASLKYFFTRATEFYCCKEPRVEILYTENVDLNQRYIKWDIVRTIGKGSSTPGGLPKRRLCSTCNLYPLQSPLGDPNRF